MIESRAAENTRQRNLERRAAADAQAAECRARILGALAEICQDSKASVQERLEAGRLAVELKRWC